MSVDRLPRRPRRASTLLRRHHDPLAGTTTTEYLGSSCFHRSRLPRFCLIREHPHSRKLDSSRETARREYLRPHRHDRGVSERRRRVVVGRVERQRVLLQLQGDLPSVSPPRVRIPCTGPPARRRRRLEVAATSVIPRVGPTALLASGAGRRTADARRLTWRTSVRLLKSLSGGGNGSPVFGAGGRRLSICLSAAAVSAWHDDDEISVFPPA